MNRTKLSSVAMAIFTVLAFGSSEDGAGGDKSEIATQDRNRGQGASPIPFEADGNFPCSDPNDKCIDYHGIGVVAETDIHVEGYEKDWIGKTVYFDFAPRSNKNAFADTVTFDDGKTWTECLHHVPYQVCADTIHDRFVGRPMVGIGKIVATVDAWGSDDIVIVPTTFIAADDPYRVAMRLEAILEGTGPRHLGTREVHSLDADRKSAFLEPFGGEDAVSEGMASDVGFMRIGSVTVPFLRDRDHLFESAMVCKSIEILGSEWVDVRLAANNRNSSEVIECDEPETPPDDILAALSPLGKAAYRHMGKDDLDFKYTDWVHLYGQKDCDGDPVWRLPSFGGDQFDRKRTEEEAVAGRLAVRNSELEDQMAAWTSVLNARGTLPDGERIASYDLGEAHEHYDMEKRRWNITFELGAVGDRALKKGGETVYCKWQTVLGEKNLDCDLLRDYMTHVSMGVQEAEEVTKNNIPITTLVLWKGAGLKYHKKCLNAVDRNGTFVTDRGVGKHEVIETYYEVYIGDKLVASRYPPQ